MSGKRDDDVSLFSPRQAVIGFLALLGALIAGGAAGLGSGLFVGVVAHMGFGWGLAAGILAGLAAGGLTFLKVAQGLDRLIARDSRRDEEPPPQGSGSATPHPANRPAR